MKKRGSITVSLLVAAVFSISLFGANTKTIAASKTAELSGTINVWSSGDEMKRFAGDFMSKYPKVKVNVTVIPNSDFLTKMKPTLQSGQGAPDVFTGESDYVKYLIDTPFWENLSKAPYNAETSAKSLWKYVVDIGRGADGGIRALSWQAAPGSVLYRRDLAKKYIGTDDPNLISKLMNSYNGMMKMAKTLKDKTSGKVRMFASWQDVFNMQFSNRTQPWVVSNKLVVPKTMQDFYDIAKNISVNKYDLNADPWSPAWSAAVDGGNAFCYVLPTWGLQYLIIPNAKASNGKWGVASGPMPYCKGGTWLGVYSGSKNKELAWEFVKFATVDEQEAEHYAKTYGEYMANKNVDNKLAKEPGIATIAGQNSYKFYNSQMDKIPTKLMTKYDQQINNAYLNSIKQYISSGISKADAIKQFKDDVKNAYPELDIE